VAALAAPRRAFGARRTGDRTRRRRVDGRRDRPRDRSFVVVVVRRRRRRLERRASETRGAVSSRRKRNLLSQRHPAERASCALGDIVAREYGARGGRGDVEREQSVVARLREEGAVA